MKKYLEKINLIKVVMLISSVIALFDINYMIYGVLGIGLCVWDMTPCEETVIDNRVKEQ